MFIRRIVAAAAIALGLTGAAQAADYPNRPVKVVIGFPAGGPTDVAARILAKYMGEHLGQPFVVENRTGASGAIAVRGVVGVEPDGYTILMGNSGSMSVLPYLIKDLGYDPLTQLDPIGLVVNLPSVLAVPTDSPFKSVPDMLAYAKANPGKLTYASQGIGSLNHIATEWFKLITGVDITHVPYRGDAPSIQDLTAGRVDMSFFSIVSALPQLQGKRLRLLGVATSKPLDELPGVPTVMSQGVSGFVAEPWNAFLTPKGVPADIREKLNKAMNDALKDKDVLASLRGVGLYPMGGSPEDLANYMKSQSALWSDVIKRANITQ
ncbi:hypothetical protein JL37_26000 [Achromobacter sp. RTa]|uniref:Bug family tripartite tricarboxylate transporter substrate binding protein n=1 Tax=Achromobacter sp. RTa TaxID=1532557 RepID=UPI00050FEBE7|nr:tripartite tricarboxylate transporter substrate binding protein [Achromobacter sp. RTa]KGD88034.1 hypothetical protein JL37_26000 [Achromobacter sp. RTa]